MDAKLSEQSQSSTCEPDDRVRQAELVKRCLQGDEQAFALIVEQYGALLLRTAYLIVQDEEAANDIVQDVFLLAWKSLHQLREPAALRAWLLRIVVNQSTSLKRQWARKTALLRQQLLQQQIEHTIQFADFQRGLLEDTLDMWQAIQQLPLNQRVVLVLYYYNHMTMREIVSLLDVSENTLRKRLLAALTKVRKILKIEPPGRKEEQVAPGSVAAHNRLNEDKHDG